MDNKAMYKISYGLFVLTASDEGKDNGCIINTAAQVTSTPNRISITVNKQNYTHDMIAKTGVFNVSVLTENAPFSLFQRFGFQSGKTADKFAGLNYAFRLENGVMFLAEYTNAYICGKVVQSVDLGTHTMFIADVTDCEILGDDPSVTYTYYQSHIKPKPQPKQAAAAKKSWTCSICGYVYEGDELPADFTCPLCKHGASDFELNQ